MCTVSAVSTVDARTFKIIIRNLQATTYINIEQYTVDKYKICRDCRCSTHDHKLVLIVTFALHLSQCSLNG